MMRHRIATWFFLACLTAHAQVPEYVPTDGLLSWSNLNVFDGAIVVGGAVPDTGRFGIAENAYRFDGTNDVIEVQVEEGLPSGNDARSTSIWFNAESFDSWLPVTLVHYGIPSTNNRWFLLLSSDYPHIGGHNNDLCPPCTCAGCTEVTVTENQQPLLPNMWHHIAVTHDGQTMRVYVDGQLHFYGDKQFNTVETNVFNVGFSDATHNGGEPFLGKLQSVGMWDRALTEEEVAQLHLGELPEFGCTDSNACNFDVEANLDDGSCYPCDIPAAHCGPGTVWDASTQLCVGGNPSDTDFDGCVGMADLLDLLSAFGTCVEEDPAEGADAWSCGDPVDYQGYDYETVQIGEQCWFAENLRAESYRNGDAMSTNLNNSEWQNISSGAFAEPVGDSLGIELYGMLYNGYAVLDERALCPSGWNVPSDQQWMAMEIANGMTPAEANDSGWRGENQGHLLKSQSGWNLEGGDNEVGFSALPGGFRGVSGDFGSDGISAYWWTRSMGESTLWIRHLRSDESRIYRNANDALSTGFSVRCIQDSE